MGSNPVGITTSALIAQPKTGCKPAEKIKVVAKLLYCKLWSKLLDLGYTYIECRIAGITTLDIWVIY
jgi:hypothetical protein